MEEISSTSEATAQKVDDWETVVDRFSETLK
jgi:hypothetical protein